MTNRDAAQAYLARQWSVLPVGDNKRPLVSWQEYQRRQCSDDELGQWFSRWPAAGVGVVTGEVSGLLVVDIDAGNPGDEAAAERFAAARAKVDGFMPDSLVVPVARTRRGGLHYYFRRPSQGMGNRAHVGGYAIDVRCDGGYVVAPPTPGYSWQVTPDEVELTEVPPALLEFLAVRPAPVALIPAAPAGAPVSSIVTERARRYVYTMDPAVSGNDGHGHTFRVACVLTWGFCLDESDAWDILVEYNSRACIPPWSERELRHKLDSALNCTTHQKPRGYLLGDARPQRQLTAGGVASTEDHDSNEGRDEPEEIGNPRDGSRRELPIIRVGPDEYRVVAEAIEALAAQRHYYQRGPNLVRIVQEVAPPGEPRAPAHIDVVPHSSLEVALSAAARWEQLKPTKANPDRWVHAQPPKWAVQGVATARNWHGVQPLVGVVSSPVIRADGSLLNDPGYDEASGLWYKPCGPVGPVPAEPTPEQAATARDLLLDAVCDFPFASDDHRAAWLALVLTPFARHAMTDGCPLGYIDANTRGSGKSLLASVTALIALGRRVPMCAWPEAEEERDKRITTYVVEGDTLVIFDNCEYMIGGQTMNSILTAPSWKSRILSKTQSTGEIPLRTFFIATGNNCDFAADTTRRTIHVRLQSPLEKPETRSDFVRPDLVAWITGQRGRLVAAALTILRGYHVAGAPDMGLGSMGGFTWWHRLIRNAVVWVGMSDPVKTQAGLTLTADRNTAELAALLDGISHAQKGTTEWHTSQQLLSLATLPGGERLHDALMEHAPDRRGNLPNPRVLGMLLRRHVDRVFGGLVLRRKVISGGTPTWRVRPGSDEPT